MKTIITTVLLITMLPIMGQQRQMSLEATFDKQEMPDIYSKKQ